jgi:CheY-like chemotaxis protein
MSFKVLIVDVNRIWKFSPAALPQKIKDSELEFVCTDSQEALNKLPEDPALDVVMSDINMPIMMADTLLSR